MQRHATPRSITFVILVATLFLAALVSGRTEPVALAIPLFLALCYGTIAGDKPTLKVEVSVAGDRLLEGDDVDLSIKVSSTDLVPELDIALLVPRGFSVTSPRSFRVRAQPDGPQELTVKLKAENWGVHEAGGVAVRAWGPGRLVTHEDVFPPGHFLKVFPRFERIVTGILPPEPQLFAGEYVSPLSGSGIEFASVREFQGGDEIRNINWKVSSRRAGMYVNTSHPERNSDVVLFLDTFGDHGDGDVGGSLESAVRGAAGLALHHLKRRDRVGVISFGGVVRWLPVSMARPHLYRLLDVLLDAQVRFSFAWKDVRLLPPKTLPTGSSVIAFSPLVDKRAVAALQNVQERGFPLVIVDTLAVEDIAPLPGPEGDLAHRVWRLQREAVRAEFAQKGVPVVRWSEEDFLDSVLAAVPRLPRVRRGAGA